MEFVCAGYVYKYIIISLLSCRALCKCKRRKNIEDKNKECLTTTNWGTWIFHEQIEHTHTYISPTCDWKKKVFFIFILLYIMVRVTVYQKLDRTGTWSESVRYKKLKSQLQSKICGNTKISRYNYGTYTNTTCINSDEKVMSTGCGFVIGAT